MYGSSMGVVAFTAQVRTGHTSCESPSWESDTWVRAHSSVFPGGGTRRVVMTAGEGGGSITKAWSVDTALVSDVRRSKRAGTGSVSVTVHGANMGVVIYTVKLRGGQSAGEATEWESETSERCLVTHGAGGTKRVSITLTERDKSATQAWSVDVSGSLVRLLISNSPMTGRQPLFVRCTGDFCLFGVFSDCFAFLEFFCIATILS